MEAFLKEDPALTKGSQRIMNDKKLVKTLAATVRDDADFHPHSFPAGMDRKFSKAPDEEVAHWFLQSLDDIERRGYEGNVYSRDGVNSDWIVKTYLAGTSNWEDVVGNLNMVLNSWYLLKNRNQLEPQHKELSQFKSINQLNSTIQHHYGPALKAAADAAKKNALRKTSKTIPLVDNDDYKIQVPLNRIGSMLIADGAGWCTANAEYAGHWNHYANRAMLFVVLPYEQDEETGEKTFVSKEVTVRQGARAGQKLETIDKFQFDTGSGDFMDIGNAPVNPPSIIATKWPYLYDDIVTALRTKKGQIEGAFEALSKDPALQSDDQKIKVYDVDKQIKDLDIFVNKGYLTKKKRPSQQEMDNAAGEQPQIGQAPAQQPPQEQQMESIRDLARTMLEDITLGHIVRSFKPVNTDGEESPMTYGEDNLDEDEFSECAGVDAAKDRLAQALGGQQDAVDEDEDMGDAGAGAQSATGGGGSLGSVGAGGGGGQYPTGTAPTMPESINNKGNQVMENVDKDVAAMLNSLKKYDKLNESVLGMVTLSMARPQVAEGWDEDQAKKEKLKAPPEEVNIEEELDEAGPAKHEIPAAFRKEKGGDWKTTKAELDTEADKSPTTKKGLENLKAQKGIKETADPEILAWMNRFSKLGNMKGYGR